MRRLLTGLLALALAASLTACGHEPPQDDGRLRVVCTLFPYYDFARQIGGDAVDVALLVPAGRETHSFEPTPRDVIRISEADVFIYNGGESEQWVSDILDAAGEDIPCVLSMMDTAELYEEEYAEGMQGASGHDHADHDHDHGAEDEDAAYDEHIWTSPVTAMSLCRAIADALCRADPAHAEDFRARLTDYLAALEALDGTFREIVAEGSRNLLVFGDRFPLLYFCREYAFHSCQTVSRAEFDSGVTYLQLMEANADALREGLS